MAVILYRYMEKDKAVYAKSNKFGFVSIEMRVYPNFSELGSQARLINLAPMILHQHCGKVGRRKTFLF